MSAPDPRRPLNTFAAAMAVLIVTPLGVGAADRFSDVSGSNIFHDDIQWLAEAGVTRGCNPSDDSDDGPPPDPEFCPGDNVTREQMAAFLKRLAENQVVDASQLAGRAPVAYRTVVRGASCDQVTASSCPNSGTLFALDLVAPSEGFVKLDYSMSLQSTNTGDSVVHAWVNSDDACNWRLVPLDALDGSFSVSYYPDLDEPDFHALSGTTTVSIPRGTTTFSLCAMAIDLEVAYASLGAVWSPEGAAVATASVDEYMEFPESFGSEFEGVEVPGFDN